MFERLCNKFLPKYIRIFCSRYWIAIWSAPVRYEGRWRIKGKWIPVQRNDTAFQALRITIRYGDIHERIVYVVKKGVV